MCLLERIAHSNGNPQRTIAALRLLNAHLARTLCQHQSPPLSEPCANVEALHLGVESLGRRSLSPERCPRT